MQFFNTNSTFSPCSLPNYDNSGHGNCCQIMPGGLLRSHVISHRWRHWQQCAAMATSTRTFKVILYGDYGVGKSSVFRRFVDNSFTTQAGPSSTIGLDHYAQKYTAFGETIKVSAGPPAQLPLLRTCRPASKC